MTNYSFHSNVAKAIRREHESDRQADDERALRPPHLRGDRQQVGGGLDLLLPRPPAHVLQPVHAHHRKEVRIFAAI